MNYADMKYADLKKIAVEKGVYKPGMNTQALVTLLSSLDTVPTSNDESQGEVASGVKTVAPSVLKGDSGVVVFSSLDGRVLEVSINTAIWKGKTITVPLEVAEDVQRLLKDGGFLATRID